jgi:Alpha/beta hydrolase domain
MSKKQKGMARRATPQFHKRTLVSLGVACALAATGTMLVATSAEARVTKINITTQESPTYGGFSFPGVGQYEKIAGTMTAEISPTDAHNAGIVDLALAPRLPDGNVQYSFAFYILKPIDLTKGNHKIFYEAPNRGGKLSGTFNQTTGGNDPATTSNPGGAFLNPQGYTLAYSGWDQAAGQNSAAFNSTITLPVAKNADGTSITGPVYDYIENDNATTMTSTLTYTPNSLDQTQAQLTVKAHLNDVPTVIPASGWAYTKVTTGVITNDGTAIQLLPAGTAFAQGSIYEFTYTGKDPTVNAIGFAAVRDFASFLRYATADDAGTPNPMAGDVQRIYTYSVSQPTRMLNDFVSLGFNADESNRKVFDGVDKWIGAADGINMNLRFSQPGRTERNRQHHLYQEGVFPFANTMMTDPITGKTDSRYAKCTASNTCPVAVEIYSANEYWVKAASLFHTDPAGTIDVAPNPIAPIYFMSSHQHGTGNGAAKGACQQFQNPIDSTPVHRALLVAMDQFITNGTPMPPSMLPTFATGTLVTPATVVSKFPKIPGVTVTGLESTRYLFNYGPRMAQGIMDINPPVITIPYENNPLNGKIYPSFVPMVDADGNDVAGFKMPEVAVPLATYTGWALRSAAFGLNDGCEGTGQQIAFAPTAAARAASGDPRLSIQERYGSFSGYYYTLLFAIDNMVAQRMLLPADAATAFNAGLVRALNSGLVPKSEELDALMARLSSMNGE